jgi:hypothetical protein
MITIATIIFITQVISNGISAFVCFGSAASAIYMLLVSEGVDMNEY